MVRWYGQLRRGGMINLRQLRLLVFFGAGLAPAPGFFLSRLRLQGAKNTYCARQVGRAGEPEPVGAGCFWLLGAGARAGAA